MNLKLLFSVAMFCVSAVAMAGTQDPCYSNTGNFFVQTADQAMLKPGHLILMNADPRVICFADAPSTAASIQSVDKYLLAWSIGGSFTKLNPNAALIGTFMNPQTHKKDRLSAVLVLQNAHYDQQKHTLTYDVKKSILVPSSNNADHGVLLQHPTLFIDPNPPGTIAPIG